MPRSSPATADLGARVAALLRFEPDVSFRRRARIVVEYLDPGPDDRILDAGCGLGFYLHLLGEIADSRLYGVEVSAPRLREAAAVNHRAGAHLFLGDVTQLPFLDGSFDKVILSEVLEHVRDDRAALAEVCRVLHPGGVAAVTVPHRHYPFLWDPLNYTRERLGLGHFSADPWSGIWTDHVRLYEPRELEALAHAVGLEPTDVHLETRYAFPFSHHLIYGLGKLLVERGMAGGGSLAGRTSFWGAGPGRRSLRTLIRAFTALDRLNQPRYYEGPAVTVCMRAVRPESG